MDTEVLIVGAGPTGLMLANQLARRGVRVLIIDRHAAPARETRALGVQARTLEIYAKLGVIDHALALGKIGTGANMWANGRHMARVPLGDAGDRVSPYPYILVLGQDDNERILGDRLREFGVEVQWNTELVDLRQDPLGVTAQLKQPDGSLRAVTGAWVGGCDGARSAVRQLCGIDFPGAPYEHSFFVADMQMTGPMVADEVNVYLWRSGFHLFFPMRGLDHWRIVGIVPEQLRARDDLRFEDVQPSLHAEAGDAMRFAGCSWFSTYRIHHRRAERFRQGRCFLLGDAAHIHSPVGAQGMNTGLQDGYNLGWKLAAVCRGEADARLLDSYEDERLPVAERLLSTTDRAFRLVISDHPLAGLMRTQVIARAAGVAMRWRWVQRLAFRTVSQTGIAYADSALSEARDRLPSRAPRAGDRFPWPHLRLRSDGPVEDLFATLDDRCFHLLVIGQPLPADMVSLPGALVQVHVISRDADNDAALERVRIPRCAYYLVRPDGHVGLCGTLLEATTVTRYLRERLGVG